MNYFYYEELLEAIIVYKGLLLLVTLNHIIICKNIDGNGGAVGVMVIVVGNGHGDTSSNPRRD